MAHLPVLASGAVAQFPISKLRRHYTILTEGPDGTEIKLSRQGERRVEWRLEFAGLTEAELEALAGFFADREGRLKPFAFVDPTANLLRHSEDLSRDVWFKDPALEVEVAGQGPAGTGAAARLANTGAAEQKIEQRLAAPAALPYCFSVYARAQESAEFTLSLRGGEAESRQSFAAGASWRRFWVWKAAGEGADGVTAAVELGAGVQIEIAGLQLECQFAPSGYKPTAGNGGVYPGARFDSDRLEVVAEGPDEYRLAFDITAYEP
jgi:hypothetical protein